MFFASVANSPDAQLRNRTRSGRAHHHAGRKCKIDPGFLAIAVSSSAVLSARTCRRGSTLQGRFRRSTGGFDLPPPPLFRVRHRRTRGGSQRASEPAHAGAPTVRIDSRFVSAAVFFRAYFGRFQSERRPSHVFWNGPPPRVVVSHFPDFHTPLSVRWTLAPT